MTLTPDERETLRTSIYREARTKIWFFEFDINDTEFATELGKVYSDAQTVGSGTEPFVDNNAATAGFPLIVVDPPVAIINPGESITLTAYAYLYDHAETQLNTTNIQWSIHGSGSANLSTNIGPTCVVTPLGGESSEVIVKVTYTRTVSYSGDTWVYTTDRLIPIAASTLGYQTITGQIQITGAFGQDWRAQIEVSGDSAGFTFLQGRWCLIHMDTYYEGVKKSIGLGARPENMFFGQVSGFQTRRDDRDRRVTTINLIPFSEVINAAQLYLTNDAKSQDWDEVGQKQPIYFVGNAGSGADPTSLVTYIQHVIGTDPLMTTARASFYIAGFTPVKKHANVIIWDDSRKFNLAQQEVRGIWDMMKGPQRSNFGMPYCDQEGSLRLLPMPGVRGDEYWSTGDALWTETSPLNRDYNVGDIKATYYPGRHPSGQAWDGAVINGYDDALDPQSVSSGDVGLQYLFNNDYTGYFLRGDAVESDWASDILNLINRTFDLEAEFPCSGRAFTVGAFIYVDLPSGLTGVPTIEGMTYVNRVTHRIDVGRSMQWTDVQFVELTGGLT